MSLTQFPNGITSFGIPIVGGAYLTTGNIFFADSGTGSNGNTGEDTNHPFADIDYAIGQGTASNGDIILTFPGHDENPTTSITADIAGIWICGLGWGANRPTITFGALAAALDISAASVRVSNLRFDLGTVAATVTNGINITGEAAIVDGCETVIHATSQFTNLLTATDVQFVKIYNNKFHSLETAGATSGIVVDGCDDIEIVGNQVAGHFGEHALDNTTPGACDEILRAYIADNSFKNDSTTAGDLAVELDDNATGMFARNAISCGLATIAAGFDIGKMSNIESYIVDDAGLDVSGKILSTLAA